MHALGFIVYVFAVFNHALSHAVPTSAKLTASAVESKIFLITIDLPPLFPIPVKWG